MKFIASFTVLCIFAILFLDHVESQQFGLRRRYRPTSYHLRPFDRNARTVKDFRSPDEGDGTFNYDVQTQNGINVNAVGKPGRRGQANISGSYSYPLPGGGIAVVRYVADELGFRAESPLIPTPPPLPAHALKQIRVAQEQRARGIRWE